MSGKASKSSIRSKKLSKPKIKQLDPFHDPTKEVREFCDFCTKPPQKPSLFNKHNLPFTVSTTSASWEGGTCCIRVREIGVSIDPPDETTAILGATEIRHETRKNNWVYRTPSDLERERDRDYRITLKRTLEDEKWERRLGFQRLKEKRRKLMSDVGPTWYQELSFKQMECMSMLGGTIVADMEEGLVARTQRLLARFGILPRPTNGQIQKAIDKCGLNPIIFLIYFYKYTTLVEGNRIESDSPFTINDRLLLSGLTYLALPMTLFDLHCTLPPPPEKYIPKPKAKPLVKRKNYTSPYLHPQPICKYNNLLDKKIEQQRVHIGKLGGLIVEDVVIEAVSQEQLIETQRLGSVDMSVNSFNTAGGKKGNTRFFVDAIKSSMQQYGNIGKPSTFSVAMFENAMRQVGGGMIADSSSAVFPDKDRKSIYLQNQLDTKNSEATKARLDNMQQDKAEARRQRELNENEEEKEIRSSVPEWDDEYASDVRFHTVPLQCSDAKKANETPKRKLVIPEIIITYAPDEPMMDYEDYAYDFDENYIYQYDAPKIQPVTDVRETKSEDKKLSEPICNCPIALAERLRRPRTGLDADGLFFSPSDILPCPIPTVTSLKAAFIGYWKGVPIPPDSMGQGTKSLESILYKTESVYNQFMVALEILARQGNILAGLPQVEKLPVLRCWLRLYKGNKLTPELKAKLMNKSFGQWGQKQQHPHTAQLPSLKLKNPSKLNWDCKHWLLNKVNNIYHKYYSNVRKAQVEDAREYWIAMCMEYFKTPAEFRNVYFAYLPCRENDVLAVRPWNGWV